MPQASTILPVLIPALAVGVIVGFVIGRRGGKAQAPVQRPEPQNDPDVSPGAASALRASALETAPVPVLIVGRDGRVRDGNVAALQMLGRPRGEVIDVAAFALRSLLTTDGRRIEQGELEALEALETPWSGEAHLRRADGSLSLFEVRLAPVTGARGEVTDFVEVYRDRSQTSPASAPFIQPDSEPVLPASITSAAAVPATNRVLPPAEGARRDLHILSLAIADLARVVRQYELLLPAMRAEDPLSEAIAGLAAETREVVTAADVPRLLRELPQALVRLRSAVERLEVERLEGSGDRSPHG